MAASPECFLGHAQYRGDPWPRGAHGIDEDEAPWVPERQGLRAAVRNLPGMLGGPLAEACDKGLEEFVHPSSAEGSSVQAAKTRCGLSWLHF